MLLAVRAEAASRPDPSCERPGSAAAVASGPATTECGFGNEAAGRAAGLSPSSSSAAVETSTLPSREDILSPRLSALEERLFSQIHDGRFGGFSLLEAALIAGGVDRVEELRHYRERFDVLVEALRRSDKVRGTPRQRAQAVFAFLHESLLFGGYNLQASDLRQAMDVGRFNCVTASVLFNCLASEFELQAVGLEAPGHAMSRLLLSEETLDVETTCPRWFALMAPAGSGDPRRTAGDPRRTVAGVPALAGVPPPTTSTWCPGGTPAGRDQGARSPLRQVLDVQLVATIYYNRGIDLLSGKRYAAAAAANAKAVRLDPENATARGNLLATINNWAIDLGTAGKYAQAAELLRLGLATDPGYEAFHSNYVQLYRQWSDRLCRSGRYEDAVRLLHQAGEEQGCSPRGEQPDERFFREAAIEVRRRQAEK